ncbi:MAG: class II D-tagatose-bisphosphate aldolase, non-catalytic subunit [Anaerolineales bacterium]|jgi:tagatose-1,6-bisphosphate aldolase non-catalytic subunit AgaZ/GatZ
MKPVSMLVQRLLRLREGKATPMTLLALCPNSEAVLEAAVRVASRNNLPILFAATLNQVDRDGGYTSWTPKEFVTRLKRIARQYKWSGPLIPCLDHGGPWLKDRHREANFSLEATLREVKKSLRACLLAGYQLLHIDATLDIEKGESQPPPIGLVVSRTLDLIRFCEAERRRLTLPPVDYEVGTEEVHGGLTDIPTFREFVNLLRRRLEEEGLLDAWPCFIVGKVGTNLHTTYFDPKMAQQLFAIVSPLGSLIKGHYTDWVENASAYPDSGMGAANVGPEFTSAEFAALADLCQKELDLERARGRIRPSRFMDCLESAVVRSGRWKKWLLPGERGERFQELRPERRDWLTQTGARYVWTDPEVRAARRRLYRNLARAGLDSHEYVIERISQSIDHYVNSFRLFDSLSLFKQSS